MPTLRWPSLISTGVVPSSIIGQAGPRKKTVPVGSEHIGIRHMNAVSCLAQVSLLSVESSDPSSWFAFKPRAYRRSHAFTGLHPLGRVSHDVSWASPFPSRLATTTGRIEFVILRTSHSLPVALHPLSQGRSYHRLQSSNQTLAGTFTPPTRCDYRRTRVRSADHFYFVVA